MNAREIALNILKDINIKGAYSNYSINKHLTNEISIKDENLIREIVYGVVENRLYIDYIISKASKIKLKKIHPTILEILRIGVYQMIFMDKIPDSAAVNEAVNLSKKHGHKGVSGFINGVLRNIARNKERFKQIDEKDNLNYLSIKYSYPKWMLKRWIDDYGYDFVEELCNVNNSKPLLNIRVNTLKINRNELLNRLKNYGYIVYETKYAKDGIVIENPTRITETEEFKQGFFIIQDESSMLVAQIANPKKQSNVLDLCSAPGGKATHMAQIMENQGYIKCWDIYEHKLNLINKNSYRLGINIIDTEIHDATKLDNRLIGQMDYCIADVPCSGLGIIRRRPEIKWNRKEEDINKLKEIQFKILDNAKQYVKPGGIIIYSTCTISKDENEKVIGRFLNENDDFKLLSFENLICDKRHMEESKNGYIQLFPHIHGTDGFFIAKIIKDL
ncbi:NusB antitermination factor [Keratinibaculum paraultunense]|uniref:16S rRNA (cytosine(967)-C(5))-methyltransferase n=1 Tax=Keratinibaculum paraultunense TaxID=1278232 RepID=A0A4R3KYH3_9FIRM|nr:16S rRNA (cytosine(967)-C(5))-methyltransferase RsmB [Keratinibaculum paraultunense]QQY80786.1 16S rRNA (cytosine(967)-C(5))-methyltransferase RsmB [Keratinibaculum paraultunense]TCS89602.1 NusB antitermination factor [Keratinibaculum paraultunense]